MMRTTITTGLVISALLALSGCVTQQYDPDAKKMVVKNEASNQEIAMTRISLALGYLKMGNTTQAKLNLEKAKYYAPDLVAVHTTFAHYYEFVGESSLANQSYHTALNINPQDADTLNNYGVFLCRQGDVEQAKAKFLAAVAVPSYTLVANSYKNLATCLLNKDEFEQANHYLDKAIQHSPSDADAIFQMMQLQYALGNMQQAQLLMHRYEKVTRRFNPDAIALGYKVYQQLGNVEASNSYAAMLVKMFPQSFAAKQYLLNGLALIEADKLAQRYQQKQQALAAISQKPKRVVKLSPKNASTTLAEKPQVKLTLPDIQDNTLTTKTTANQSEFTLSREPTTKVTEQVDEQSIVTEHTDSAQANVTTDSIIEQNSSKNLAEPALSSEQATLEVPIHIVAKGDNLFSISRKYNIRLSALMRWNKLTKKSRLYIGDKVYLADPSKGVNHDG